MATIDTINLLRSKTSLSPQLDALTKRLAVASRIAIGTFFVLAVVVGGAYVFLAQQKNSIIAQNNSLAAQIAQDTTKEALYVTLQQRVDVVKTAMGSQRSWGGVLDTVGSVIQPPALTSISVNDQNRVEFTLIAPTLDELISVVNAFLVRGAQERIKSPELISFQLLKDGSFQITVSFVSSS